MRCKDIKIAVIGLGYVGLPLARLFATKYPVIGFDVNEKRIEELNQGRDTSLEVENSMLQAVLITKKSVLKNQIGLFCSSKKEDIKDCNFYIVTVPTPVDKNNRPDLGPLLEASKIIGMVVSLYDVVVYESTVYPGATEEDCIPVIEKISGLKYNKDFFAGYSPERVNPGDKEHTVEIIKKVTSGSNPEIACFIDEVYKSVIKGGTHLASSIKVAEASKVIENTQRDINIAFINELKKIFDKMGISTLDVLEAAGTKWNFLKFKPGLVGGHCIGVDPYYLAQKAQEYDYHPEIILAGRRINDSMGEYVGTQVVKQMIKKGVLIKGSDILILGITFKENCTDIRNTKVVDVVNVLREYEVNISIYDPWAKPEEVREEYNLNILKEFPDKKFDAIIVAVNHKDFESINFSSLRKDTSVFYSLQE
ncbi:MAG: nucleotide sugar dehydrogenase [Bacteroidales bacterium]|nr:nucleotide sugar dehydrogenase [Bacteroidales bacterium]